MFITISRIFTVIFIFAIMAYSLSSTSHAQCPPAYTFTGEATNDQFGFSVSGTGDVNNDGFADVIVGARFNGAAGDSAGRAYVYSGQTGALLYTFTGEAARDRFGISVSGAGDVNNDGYADVIVGAWLNDAGGSDAGRAYVYSGQTGTLLYTFTGEAAYDLFGIFVSGAGDVNNDGFADVIVGAFHNYAGGIHAGRAYVYSGQTGALLYTFTGEGGNNLFGYSVSGAGDVNNDGFADVIIGALGNSAGGIDAGRAYVYSGQTGGLLYTFTGEAAYDLFGISAGAGDVNNDGFADVIVGASRHDAGGTNTGRAYVYSGQTGALLYTFTGEAAADQFGYSVSGAGDVNDDGYADLIAGSPFNGAGRAYVYLLGDVCDPSNGILEPSDNSVPWDFTLAQNYPNPFNLGTMITFTLPEPAEVNITVYNILGRKVRQVISESYPAGPHVVRFNGKDSNNKPLSSGIYFYRIQAGNLTQAKKMVLLK